MARFGEQVTRARDRYKDALDIHKPRRFLSRLELADLTLGHIAATSEPVTCETGLLAQLAEPLRQIGPRLPQLLRTKRHSKCFAYSANGTEWIREIRFHSMYGVMSPVNSSRLICVPSGRKLRCTIRASSNIHQSVPERGNP